MNLGGSFTFANVGTFNRSGGTVNLTGTLTNANATLPLTAATGSWALLGGSIIGGTITDSSGALAFAHRQRWNAQRRDRLQRLNH